MRYVVARIQPAEMLLLGMNRVPRIKTICTRERDCQPCLSSYSVCYSCSNSDRIILSLFQKGNLKFVLVGDL